MNKRNTNKQKKYLYDNKKISIENALKIYFELVKASKTAERKYMVLINRHNQRGNHVGHVYYIDAANHDAALEGALRLYTMSPYPQVKAVYCIVNGLCNDRNCYCGHQP